MPPPKDWTLSELRELLDKGSISSVEITQHYLQRIEKYNSNLNTFISVIRDQALILAELADKRIANKDNVLPLTGIPIALKDNILMKDVGATAGSKFLKDFVSPYHSTVAKKLLDAGAVIVGKTNCDEFAMGSSNENSAFGPVHNPWKHGFAPGGSSGGSAASVAARLVPAALGTDTGGSIRQPAAFCGVVGLKPTYGRVSRYGIIAFASSLDQVGPLTRTVKDNAMVYDSLCGHDPMDSTSSKHPNEITYKALDSVRDLKGLKIGFARELLTERIDPLIRDNVLASIEIYAKLGAVITDVSLPHLDYGIACYYVLAPAEASANLARYDGIRFTARSPRSMNVEDTYAKSRSEGFGPEVKRRILLGTFVLSTGYYDTFYLKAQKVRSLIRQDFMNAFQNVDVILTPTTPSPAFPLGSKNENPLDMYLSDAFTVPVPIAGLPGISIPSGFTNDSRPMGIQLIGKPFAEKTLFETAYSFEQETLFHERVPTL
ncbi:MAG: Asp-tRNA(Asn)/Glu-tRNA(Gln) amidotransferase subunit GatA [Bdellovibrionales bacterium]|nr:Asp-tRNA(Asn)/Glu-tRNA(Gln) amidotransferase subunit GatA [Bdellovibrionales bacterium]